LRKQQGKPALIEPLNIQLGQMFSNGIHIFLQKYGIDTNEIDIVGAYLPKLLQSNLTGEVRTQPPGWNVVIEAETGITTASDFSIVEYAGARQRISPVAFVHSLLLRHSKKFRACLDIDELVNISLLPPSEEDVARPIVSRPCGPGSLFIDYAMRYCTSNDHDQDHKGRYARNGTSNQEIVDRFLRSHEYLRISPPLTMAREMFGDHDAQHLIDECLYANMSEADSVATITRVTAGSILKHYRKLLDMFFPDDQINEIFICGPSARNPHIVDFLESELPDTGTTKLLDAIGICGDANGAFCYAHLAMQTVLGQLTYAPDHAQASSTEAVNGLIVPGQNWEQLANQVRMFSQGNPLHVNRDIRVAGNLETAVKGLKL
jgi:1,6-anhydro-N-acetylmuramate kinase